MKDFFIDPQYLTDVMVTTYYKKYQDQDHVTHEELIDAIKYPGGAIMMGSKDHPEFSFLRDELERQGYIACQRMWWNGDRVVKPFRLNGCLFEEDEQFPCAAAMKGHLKFLKKGGDYA